MAEPSLTKRDLNVLEWLAERGWEPVEGEALAPLTGERDSWDEILLVRRLRRAIERINPHASCAMVDDAVSVVRGDHSLDPLQESLRLHQLVTEGAAGLDADVSGNERSSVLRLIDFDNPAANEFLAVRRLRLGGGGDRRRLDVVCYVNGLPVAVFELKNTGARNSDLQHGYAQLGSLLGDLREAPALWVVGDDADARVGTPSTPWEHFVRWDLNGGGAREAARGGLEVLVDGLFDQSRFLDVVRNFISFSSDRGGAVNRVRLARPHQYRAVNNAVASTVRAVFSDGRAGVVWHAPGSGKSATMMYYAAKVLRHPALGNPTLVVLSDRTTLDNQLFSAFDADVLLPERPRRAVSRHELRAELTGTTHGGIIFSTLQKFGRVTREKLDDERHPVLSERRNVIVVVDEAQRGHQGLVDGYARHLRDALPNATFIGFTATPLSERHGTRFVFGDYVDTYLPADAIRDGVAVKVVYEHRRVVGLDAAPAVRASERPAYIAADIVAHWEARSRAFEKVTGVPGKGLIVGSTRQGCARLYQEITALRTGWERAGRVKVVYAGSPSDPPWISRHIRSAHDLAVVAHQFADPSDPLELVIVQSMFLTGTRAPSLHTLYVDRPLRGTALMQAVGQVSGRFRDKDAGLVVDYVGIEEHLAEVFAAYSEADQPRQPPGQDMNNAVALVLELYRELRGQLGEPDWRAPARSGPLADDLPAVLGATNFLRRPAPDAGNQGTHAERFTRTSLALTKAFSACPMASEIGPEIRADIAFFESVRWCLVRIGDPGPPGVELLSALGLTKPKSRDLDEVFVRSLQDSPLRNLAVNAVERILRAEILSGDEHNVARRVQRSSQLELASHAYATGRLTSDEIVRELVLLGRDVSADRARAEELGLSHEEEAFYDAITWGDSVIDMVGRDALVAIARELVVAVRGEATVDWAVRAQARARLRSKIRRVLARHDYPPDLESAAVDQVLWQVAASLEE